VALASPAPAPDQASAPTPPDQPPHTVAACEARAQALAQELAAVDTQLTDLTARRADLQKQMAVARFLERWEHLATVEKALAEVEPLWMALPTRQCDLRLALADAHRALECALGRRQEAKKQHWRQVRARFHAAREQEDCALLAPLERHEHGAWLQYCAILVGQDYVWMPPSLPGTVFQRLGPHRTHALRRATCTWLHEHFPFREAEDGGPTPRAASEEQVTSKWHNRESEEGVS
jgi:hypothetical protein